MCVCVHMCVCDLHADVAPRRVRINLWPVEKGQGTGVPQSGGGGEGGRGPETGELQPLGAEHTLEGLDEARPRLLRASHNLGHSRQAQGWEAAERAGLEGKGLSQPHSGTLPPPIPPLQQLQVFQGR